jgi:hypothetical protein
LRVDVRLPRLLLGGVIVGVCHGHFAHGDVHFFAFCFLQSELRTMFCQLFFAVITKKKQKIKHYIKKLRHERQ